jgi:hypothetical protein
MATQVIVITLAVTIMGGVLALADGSKLQSANSANVHAKKMDRCLLSQWFESAHDIR